jgi:hypothetical protein
MNVIAGIPHAHVLLSSAVSVPDAKPRKSPMMRRSPVPTIKTVHFLVVYSSQVTTHA